MTHFYLVENCFGSSSVALFAVRTCYACCVSPMFFFLCVLLLSASQLIAWFMCGVMLGSLDCRSPACCSHVSRCFVLPLCLVWTNARRATRAFASRHCALFDFAFLLLLSPSLFFLSRPRSSLTPTRFRSFTCLDCPSSLTRSYEFRYR